MLLHTILKIDLIVFLMLLEDGFVTRSGFKTIRSVIANAIKISVKVFDVSLKALE